MNIPHIFFISIFKTPLIGLFVGYTSTLASVEVDKSSVLNKKREIVMMQVVEKE